jgi:hypothetical protein
MKEGIMIRLTVQADDSEVEQLLSHLKIQTDDEIEDSISLLKRTLKWLCALEDRAYDLSPDSLVLSRLAVHPCDPVASERDDTPPPQV